jgi:hypothetical protein
LVLFSEFDKETIERMASLNSPSSPSLVFSLPPPPSSTKSPRPLIHFSGKLNRQQEQTHSVGNYNGQQLPIDGNNLDLGKRISPRPISSSNNPFDQPTDEEWENLSKCNLESGEKDWLNPFDSAPLVVKVSELEPLKQRSSSPASGSDAFETGAFADSHDQSKLVTDSVSGGGLKRLSSLSKMVTSTGSAGFNKLKALSPRGTGNSEWSQLSSEKEENATDLGQDPHEIFETGITSDEPRTLKKRLSSLVKFGTSPKAGAL